MVRYLELVSISIPYTLIAIMVNNYLILAIESHNFVEKLITMVIQFNFEENISLKMWRASMISFLSDYALHSTYNL